MKCLWVSVSLTTSQKENATIACLSNAVCGTLAIIDNTYCVFDCLHGAHFVHCLTVSSSSMHVRESESLSFVRRSYAIAWLSLSVRCSLYSFIISFMKFNANLPSLLFSNYDLRLVCNDNASIAAVIPNINLIKKKYDWFGVNRFGTGGGRRSQWTGVLTVLRSGRTSLEIWARINLSVFCASRNDCRQTWIRFSEKRSISLPLNHMPSRILKILSGSWHSNRTFEHYLRVICLRLLH